MWLLSAIAGVWLTRGDNNTFTQIGLVVLVGLACKNAILIVELARELRQRGMFRVAAVAFIMGVVPLVLSSGAGAEMRHALGVAVFSGMLGMTFFGLFLTPVFYVVIQGLVERSRVPAAAGPRQREVTHA